MAKTPRNQPLHVPLPFDAFVSGILKVDPKKIGQEGDANLRPGADGKPRVVKAKTPKPADGGDALKKLRAKQKAAKKGKANRGNQAKG